LLWDLASQQGRNLEIVGLSGPPTDVIFSPDGRTLAVNTSRLGKVILLDLSSGRVLANPDFDQVNTLALSPDGRLLAVGGADSSLRLFSVPDGQPLGVFFWHQLHLEEVTFSPDGRWLATSSHDNVVKLWPVRELLSV
jgi:WD40 repeat protein